MRWWVVELELASIEQCIKFYFIKQHVPHIVSLHVLQLNALDQGQKIRTLPIVAQKLMCSMISANVLVTYLIWTLPSTLLMGLIPCDVRVSVPSGNGTMIGAAMYSLMNAQCTTAQGLLVVRGKMYTLAKKASEITLKELCSSKDKPAWLKKRYETTLRALECAKREWQQMLDSVLEGRWRVVIQGSMEHLMGQ